MSTTLLASAYRGRITAAGPAAVRVLLQAARSPQLAVAEAVQEPLVELDQAQLLV